MMHAVVMSLLVSASPGPSGQALEGRMATAGNPREAVQRLAEELVGKGIPIELETAGFDGLPQPAPMIDYRAVCLGFDAAAMRLSVLVEARSSRRVLQRKRYVFPLATLEHVVVPRRLLRAGERIASEDLVVEQIALGGGAERFALSLDQLVGRMAKRNILPGQPVELRSLERPAAVRRGAGITVQVHAGPMVVTMKGEALEDGAVGDSVRVMNPASSQVLVGRVVDFELVEVSK